ncbi:unnamed protein product [Ectocarpus sp. 13 AM-2016]
MAASCFIKAMPTCRRPGPSVNPCSTLDGSWTKKAPCCAGTAPLAALPSARATSQKRATTWSRPSLSAIRQGRLGVMRWTGRNCRFSISATSPGHPLPWVTPRPPCSNAGAPWKSPKAVRFPMTLWSQTAMPVTCTSCAKITTPSGAARRTSSTWRRKRAFRTGARWG